MEIIENNRKKNCHLMLIGNKLDLKANRKVEKDQGKKMAENLQNDIKTRFNEDIHGTVFF